MVCADGVAYIGLLLVFFREVHAEYCVWQFRLVVRHFAYVVQKPCAFRFLRVEPQFGCHDGAQVGCLACVLQQVLPVGRAVFHFADKAYEFRVQSVYAEVDSGAFTYFYYFFLYLFACFSNDFFYACGVYAPVNHELVQCETRYLAAHGVEA